MTNAFKMIAKVVENKWYHLPDFAIIVGYHLKLSGIEYQTNEQLVALLLCMYEVGFIDIDHENPEMLRVKECYVSI